MRENSSILCRNNHEAIIDPAVFDMVQRELESRQQARIDIVDTYICRKD